MWHEHKYCDHVEYIKHLSCKLEPQKLSSHTDAFWEHISFSGTIGPVAPGGGILPMTRIKTWTLDLLARNKDSGQLKNRKGYSLKKVKKIKKKYLQSYFLDLVHQILLKDAWKCSMQSLNEKGRSLKLQGTTYPLKNFKKGVLMKP